MTKWQLSDELYLTKAYMQTQSGGRSHEAFCVRRLTELAKRRRELPSNRDATPARMRVRLTRSALIGKREFMFLWRCNVACCWQFCLTLRCGDVARIWADEATASNQDLEDSRADGNHPSTGTTPHHNWRAPVDVRTL